MTMQIAVRLPEELVAQLDELVARGTYETRAAAVRSGIEALLAIRRRHATDEAILAGYRSTPQTDLDEAAALASLHDAIVQERW